jgi:hypothetical protein
MVCPKGFTIPAFLQKKSEGRRNCMSKKVITAVGVNGELKVGDLVISTDLVEYSYLVGTITEIVKLGTPRHEETSANETDDVFVDFSNANYSENRVKEIETTFSYLFNEQKSFDECSFDSVIMPPMGLINITALAENEITALLESEAAAKAFCDKILAQHQTAES